VVEVPALTVDKVVDTTGAGDAFLGGIVAGLFSINLVSYFSKLIVCQICQTFFCEINVYG